MCSPSSATAPGYRSDVSPESWARLNDETRAVARVLTNRGARMKLVATAERKQTNGGDEPAPPNRLA